MEMELYVNAHQLVREYQETIQMKKDQENNG